MIQMKMKSILALAAVAVATVAGASTNYAEVAVGRCNVFSAVYSMARDGELSDPAAFRAALETLDRTLADGKAEFAYNTLSRRCPLTARAVLGRCADFTPKAREDALAVCGYDARNVSVDLMPNEAGYVNFSLQAACVGAVSPAGIRKGVLDAAIVPARRAVRAEGGSFVGAEGAKRVKAKLDALAAELNAPRFGKAGEMLAAFGIPVEWEFIQSRILADAELDGLKARLLNGEIPFTPVLQNKLCVALGVEGYNAFVREYNGK